jgi:hypothetical protein
MSRTATGSGFREVQADRLREFIGRQGLAVWFLDEASLQWVFALMEQYADHPMDLADASLIPDLAWCGAHLSPIAPARGYQAPFVLQYR